MQSLNEFKIRDAATCSDEVTCCYTDHGTATPDKSISRQSGRSRGVKTKKLYLRVYMCHSLEVLNTMYKLRRFCLHESGFSLKFN